MVCKCLKRPKNRENPQNFKRFVAFSKFSWCARCARWAPNYASAQNDLFSLYFDYVEKRDFEWTQKLWRTAISENVNNPSKHAHFELFNELSWAKFHVELQKLHFIDFWLFSLIWSGFSPSFFLFSGQALNRQKIFFFFFLLRRHLKGRSPSNDPSSFPSSPPLQ